MRCLVQLGSLDFADGSTWQQAGDDFIEPFHCVVLDEISGRRHLVLSIGEREAFSLAARLQGVEFGRPMTYDFAAALVRGLGGHVRQVRVDRLAAGIYAAAVEVKLPFPDQSWFVRRLASCCLSAPQREGRCARPLAPPKICKYAEEHGGQWRDDEGSRRPRLSGQQRGRPTPIPAQARSGHALNDLLHGRERTISPACWQPEGISIRFPHDLHSNSTCLAPTAVRGCLRI